MELYYFPLRKSLNTLRVPLKNYIFREAVMILCSQYRGQLGLGGGTPRVNRQGGKEYFLGGKILGERYFLGVHLTPGIF